MSNMLEIWFYLLLRSKMSTEKMTVDKEKKAALSMIRLLEGYVKGVKLKWGESKTAAPKVRYSVEHGGEFLLYVKEIKSNG